VKLCELRTELHPQTLTSCTSVFAGLHLHTLSTSFVR